MKIEEFVFHARTQPVHILEKAHPRFNGTKLQIIQEGDLRYATEVPDDPGFNAFMYTRRDPARMESPFDMACGIIVHEDDSIIAYPTQDVKESHLFLYQIGRDVFFATQGSFDDPIINKANVICQAREYDIAALNTLRFTYTFDMFDAPDGPDLRLVSVRDLTTLEELLTEDMALLAQDNGFPHRTSDIDWEGFCRGDPCSECGASMRVGQEPVVGKVQMCDFHFNLLVV